MAEITPQFLDTESYIGKKDRQHWKDILTEGIVETNDLKVQEKGTPDMSVDVLIGKAYVQGDQSAIQGHYRIYNDATVNKSIAASDPTNPRKDRVIAQVKDSTDIGGALDEWELQVLTGTPAASPVVPALPDDALDLAIVDVGNGVTTITNANITDQRERIGFQNVSDKGWITAGEAWTYLSVNQITVPAGAVSKYPIGGKIKLTQTTEKFFYIADTADTVLTVNGAGLYTVADAAITLPYYSTANIPQGFPINMIPGYIKCSVYLNTKMTNITTNTLTKVLLDAESYDVGSNFASYKFTAPVTGYYSIKGSVRFIDNIVDQKQFMVLLYKDGAEVKRQFNISSGTVGWMLNIQSDLLLNKDEYIEFYAFHNTGANNISFEKGVAQTFMDIFLISII